MMMKKPSLDLLGNEWSPAALFVMAVLSLICFLSGSSIVGAVAYAVTALAMHTADSERRRGKRYMALDIAGSEVDWDWLEVSKKIFAFDVIASLAALVAVVSTAIGL